MSYAEMKERPILFSAPMVRAILEGRKTQTRRVCKGVGNNNNIIILIKATKKRIGIPTHIKDAPAHGLCPYGKVGDRLWVKEAFRVTAVHHGKEQVDASVSYVSDGEIIRHTDLFGYHSDRNTQIGQAHNFSLKNGINPSIHMPRWASRIDLLIKGVRVERLQDISEEDAWNEGVEISPLHHSERDDFKDCPLKSFKRLWQSINGEESWNQNPWVWVLEFERTQK